MKKYEAPRLYVDICVPDTTIAASWSLAAKNGGGANNQNCWGCDLVLGTMNANGQDVCFYFPGDGGAYDVFC